METEVNLKAKIDFLTPVMKSIIDRALTPTEKETIYDAIDECSGQYKDIRAKHGSMEAMKIIQKDIDIIVKKNPHKSSCKEGCSSCCHANIGSNKDEVGLVLNYCKENKIKISRGALKKRINNNSLKCIFLNNNKCKIYPIRFLVCRKYMVNTDPKQCIIERGVKKITGILVNNHAEILTSSVLGIDTVFNVDEYILTNYKKII